MYYPEKECTHVYTDGSAKVATRDGGGGVFIKFRNRQEKISLPREKMFIKLWSIR